MASEIYNQILASLYQWTSFQIGSFNLVDTAANLQNAFLDSTFVQVLQVISAIVTIGLGIAAFYLSMRKKEFEKVIAKRQVAPAEVAGMGPLQEQWGDIMRHIDSTHEGEWKFAVIEADTIVDGVLKNYFPGDTMGERLQNIDKTKLLSIDDLWDAHKIRNRLAHDSNYFLRHAEALRAVRLFESTLRELGVLQ